MTAASVSPLRQRMIEDMTIRKLAPRTQEGYIRTVKNFSAFFGASPDKASFEDVRRYQLHLVSSGAGVPTINHTLTALRFLFMVTLRKPEVVLHLPFVQQPQKLPVVLSPEEVAKLLDAAPGLKYKAALSVAYGAGLRATEVISLKVSDIDSARMVIRVEQGKGRKDRYVMLSQHLLDLLRAWWKAARPDYSSDGDHRSGCEPAGYNNHDGVRDLYAQTVLSAPNTWSVRWGLDEPAGPNGGSVVQWVQRVWSTGAIEELWEAWRVTPFGASTNPALDTFGFAKGLPSGAGWVTIDSGAIYYDGLTLPSSFKPGGLPNMAGQLPATSFEPHFSTEGATNSVDRSFTITWPK